MNLLDKMHCVFIQHLYWIFAHVYVNNIKSMENILKFTKF